MNAGMMTADPSRYHAVSVSWMIHHPLCEFAIGFFGGLKQHALFPNG
jgi:hypothetical protein